LNLSAQGWRRRIADLLTAIDQSIEANVSIRPDRTARCLIVGEALVAIIA